MRVHVVNPYGSAAMLRMAGPLIDELPRLYDVSTSETIDPTADINIHIPFHTLAGNEPLTGKHIAAYTHCNPGALPELMTACARADLVVAMSFTGRQELLNFGVNPKKIWVIPCAADNFNYRPRRVLIVGYPQPNGRKRESILLDLAFQYDLSAFEFYLAGGGWEDVAQKLAAAGVSGQIVQPVDDNVLAEFYKSADVLLITGYMEGGPLPLLEAMASGTKVLSPRFGYAADLLSDDELYDDPKDLMQKLQDLAAASIYNHQLARLWSWRDYAAEYALLIGRLTGESVDLYPERGMSRYAQLLDIIDEIRPKSICEIGTWNGNTAIRMLQHAGRYHPAKRLYYQGFDLFDEMTGEQFVRELSKVGYPENVVQKRLDATGAFINLVAGETTDTIDDLSVADLYFIDGGHSEETIENDGLYTLAILPDRSVAVFDDYYHEGKLEGMGCNKFIDGLSSDIYEVTHLSARTRADDGRLIGMVKVRRRYADIPLQRWETLAGTYTRDAGKPLRELYDLSSPYASSTTSAAGKLERASPA